jgi:hypothetical protein
MLALLDWWEYIYTYSSYAVKLKCFICTILPWQIIYPSNSSCRCCPTEPSVSSVSLPLLFLALIWCAFLDGMGRNGRSSQPSPRRIHIVRANINIHLSGWGLSIMIEAYLYYSISLQCRHPHPDTLSPALRWSRGTRPSLGQPHSLSMEWRNSGKPPRPPCHSRPRPTLHRWQGTIPGIAFAADPTILASPALRHPRPHHPQGNTMPLLLYHPRHPRPTPARTPRHPCPPPHRSSVPLPPPLSSPHIWIRGLLGLPRLAGDPPWRSGRCLRPAGWVARSSPPFLPWDSWRLHRSRRCSVVTKTQKWGPVVLWGKRDMACIPLQPYNTYFYISYHDIICSRCNTRALT